MKITIAAIGKSRPGPEQQLYQNYTRRLPWAVTCKEFECKDSNLLLRKQREAQLLSAAAQPCHRLIALSEHGKMLSSQEFAHTLGNWQQQGHSSFAFIIGGSDGLALELTDKAHLSWSLGRVTWPHMLVRALLAEQLYRAYTVLTNHPYHRN